MKNVSRFVALFLTGSVLSFIVLLSCELQPSDISAETGSISLTFEFPNDEQLVAALARASDGRTIGGPIDEAIYNYRVTGSGPGGASFEKIVTTNGAVFPVTPGTWVITVTARALNDWVIIEDGLHDILEGTLTAEIRANETYYAVIPLLPIHGTGTLTVTLSWPSGLIADPIAEGTLVPHGTGAGGMTFPFSIDAGGATATLSQSLTTGYYRFTISLFDGTQLLWRKIEAVRILNEKTSLAEYTVTAPIPQAAIEFTVRYEYQNPVLITLSGVKDTVSEDETMTISAETVPAGTWYEWYLDGELIESGTADTVTIGNGLSAGYHWLDVLVEAGAVLGSKSAGFEVITNRPRGILYTNVSTYTVSPEGKIVVWELCTVDPDDPVPLQLTKWQYEDPNYFLDYFPGCAAWSPAGDRIAFTYMTGQNYLATSLFTMRPSGAGAKKLDTVWELTGASISSIAWSPDGKKIAYTENGDFQRLKVVTIDRTAPVYHQNGLHFESSIREYRGHATRSASSSRTHHRLGVRRGVAGTATNFSHQRGRERGNTGVRIPGRRPHSSLVARRGPHCLHERHGRAVGYLLDQARRDRTRKPLFFNRRRHVSCLVARRIPDRVPVEPRREHRDLRDEQGRFRPAQSERQPGR